MSLPNALAGRRLWLLGVASLAALLALAVAALGPLQQRALADGHELPPGLAFNLQLIEDSDDIVPAGSELTVRATVSHSGAPIANTAAIEARPADKAAGFALSEGVLRVSGSFEWESESSTGSRLNLANAQLVALANAGIDEADDVIVGIDETSTATPKAALANTARGRFQAAAWDGRTMIARVLASSAVLPAVQIYEYSATDNSFSYRAQLQDTSTGPGRNTGWHERFAAGRDDQISANLSPIAVWHEDDNTAWLFIGSEGYNHASSGGQLIGGVHIYKITYTATAASVSHEHTLEPTVASTVNNSESWNRKDTGGRAEYGSSLALSADGSTLVVAARQMNHIGALYVYTKPTSSGSWGDVTYASGVKVTPVVVPAWGSGNTNRPFTPGATGTCNAYCRAVTAHEQREGASGEDDRPLLGIGKIGISADGTVIAVGAPAKQYADDTAATAFSGGVDNGQVFVYEAPAGGWTSVADVTGTEIVGRGAIPTHNQFDPATHYSTGPAKRITAATATLRPTGSWTTTATEAENFGVSVDVSADGSTIAVSSGFSSATTPSGINAINRNVAAYVFERSGSSWSGDITSPTAKYTLHTANRNWAPYGFELNPAGDTLVFGQRTYDSHNGRAVVIKKGSGWSSATIPTTEITASDTMWQLTQPAFDGSTFGTNFGVPLYNLDGDMLLISAPGDASGGNHPGSVWNWHVPGDPVCTSRTLDDITTSTCPVTIPDMGKVVIPNGSPDGAFTISGSVKLTRGGEDSTIRDTLEVTVGKVDEVASVSIGVAPDLKDPTTSNDDTTYPTVLRASGAKTRLQLKILNAGGKATAAGNLASVLVTSTGGRLSLVSAADAPNNATSTSCADLSCQITTSSINAGNAANILLQLEHNNRPTTARISVQVLSSGGKSLRAEPLEIVLAGAAETISVAAPVVGVLNVDQVGSDDDGNDVDTTTGATQDELLLAVSAKDAGGNTVAVPRATSGRVTVSDPDGNRVRSGITATFPARKNPGTAITTGCTTTSTDGSGGTCPGAAAGDPRRDATSNDNPAIVTSAGLFQVKIDVDAAASSPLKGGEYTVTVTAGGKTGMAKFNVSGGPAATGFDLMGPEGRQAIGEQFTVNATVNDAEGNPVPDGTLVTWYEPTETSGAGRATLAVSIDKVDRTKDGKASNTYLVVGAGSIYIRAIAGAGADVVTVQLGGAPAAVEAANPADALTSRNPDAYTTWRGTGRTSAADLLAGLDGISSVLLWLNGEWLRYGVVDGVEIPGSRNFTINPGQVLWLSR